MVVDNEHREHGSDPASFFIADRDVGMAPTNAAASGTDPWSAIVSPSVIATTLPVSRKRDEVGRAGVLNRFGDHDLGSYCTLRPVIDFGERWFPVGPRRDERVAEDSFGIGLRLLVIVAARPVCRGAWPSCRVRREVDPRPKEPRHSRRPVQKAVESIAEESRR